MTAEERAQAAQQRILDGKMLLSELSHTLHAIVKSQEDPTNPLTWQYAGWVSDIALKADGNIGNAILDFERRKSMQVQSSQATALARDMSVLRLN